MRAQKVLAKDFQFYFADLDTILLVQCEEDEHVTVRTTKNNISEKRRISFIRNLAAEGFIPDRYEWYCGSTDGSQGVTWIKDLSWLKIPEVVTRRAKRFMKVILAGACVLWIAMMRVVIVSGHPPALVRGPQKIAITLAAVTPDEPAAAEKTDLLAPR